MKKYPLAAAVILAAVGLVAFLWPEGEPAVQQVLQPEGVTDPTPLEERRELQLASLDRFEVFHGFSFSDRLEASGIRFRNKMTDDGGKAYKMVHYDHGNGLSVADIDGDGLLDLYFTNQIGPNGLWRNLGDGRFEDITDRAGVALDKPVSVAPSFADIDNDGDPDLYVTTVRFGNHLFENDGTGRFTDISASSGLQHVGHSSGAVFFDYDRDGLLDLYLTNVGKYTTDEMVPIQGATRFDSLAGTYTYYEGIGDSTAFAGHRYPERTETSILYKNTGDNRFVDVSQEVGLMNGGWSGDATPLDANEDGWTDLYVLDMQGSDDYYENVAGERFVSKTPEVFPKTPYGSMGVKVLDYDGDGRMDLYVTDMHSDMWETNLHIGPGREKQKPQHIPPNVVQAAEGFHLYGNALFKNYDTGYIDVADITGAETYWPWGLSSGDLNADGYEDVFVSGSMNYPFRYGVNSVLLNNRGKEFLDSEFILGVEPRRENRTAKVWFEVDCAAEQHPACESSGATGRIDVWAALGTRSSVLFDLEQDGDLDIVTNDFNSEPMVLTSDLSERKPDLRFLKIELVGTESNRDGLGAVVRVHADGRTVTQVYDGKSGYLSQSSYPLYFGLGEAETVDRIEVAWPSGRRQTVSGPLPANQLVEIVES